MIARANDVEFMERELSGRLESIGRCEKAVDTVPAMVPLQKDKTPPEQSWLGIRDAADENNFLCAVMISGASLRRCKVVKRC
jgi:hypothetical protein